MKTFNAISTNTTSCSKNKWSCPAIRSKAPVSQLVNTEVNSGNQTKRGIFYRINRIEDNINRYVEFSIPLVKNPCGASTSV